MFGRRKIAALVAEFLGTGALTLLILSVQRSTIGIPFFVAIAAGLALIALTFTFGRVSGGHFNPALTIALWTARKVTTLTALLYVVLQLLGGFLTYFLYTFMVKNQLQDVGGEFSKEILVAEVVGTLIFALAWAAAMYQNFTASTRAAVAGVGYTVGIIAASSAAIGLLNPAVALGIKAWVWGTYVLGPVLGAVIGVNLYGLLFAKPAVENELEETQAARAAVSAPTDVVAVVEEVVVAAPVAENSVKKTRATRGATASRGRGTTRKPATKRAATPRKTTRKK